MKTTLVVLLLTLLGLMGLALWQGMNTFLGGWQAATRQLARFAPVLVIAMLLDGFTEVLLPRDVVSRWLSDSAGWRGIGVASLAGALTPGGAIVGLPLAATLYKAGVGMGALMSYLTALATLSLLRVPLEAGFYGWRMTALRVVVSLVLPFIAGGMAHLLAPLFFQRTSG